MTKVALIIETRKHKALPFVLKSVMNKLSEDWKLQIFHGTDNIDYIKSITGNEGSKTGGHNVKPKLNG